MSSGDRNGLSGPTTAPLPALRSWAELRTSGLLWLINRVVFHPRGFAIGIGVEGDDGWVLLGDGREPWSFAIEGEDELFASAQATLAPIIATGRPA